MEKAYFAKLLETLLPLLQVTWNVYQLELAHWGMNHVSGTTRDAIALWVIVTFSTHSSSGKFRTIAPQKSLMNGPSTGACLSSIAAITRRGHLQLATITANAVIATEINPPKWADIQSF